MPPEGGLPTTARASPGDLFPRGGTPSCRKETPASRCAHGVQTARLQMLPLSCNKSYAMSGVFPFSSFVERLGPTDSGPINVAQKPCSSSAPRRHTWISATSIGICNTPVSTPAHASASRTGARPPTPSSTFVQVLSKTHEEVRSIGRYCVCDIHFRGRTIRQGSCNTLISGCLLLGTPTCCLDSLTLFMVSMAVHCVSLAPRTVHPVSP